MHTINSINSIPKHLFEEKMPEKRLEQLLLPDNVVETCRAIIEEQIRADLLRSYGLEPRNKILLIGPPGNGKTSLAEAIAEALMVPLITVRYDTIIGAYLGETASRLQNYLNMLVRGNVCCFLMSLIQLEKNEEINMRQVK